MAEIPIFEFGILKLSKDWKSEFRYLSERLHSFAKFALIRMIS